MQLKWFILFWTVNTLVAQAGESNPKSLPELAKKVRPSVYMITEYDSSGRELSAGTGFMVNAEGKMITNKHVIEKGATFKVKSSTGGTFNVLRVVATDTKNDLAILKVECQGVEFLQLGESENIEAGVRLAVVGSPLGLAGSLSEGIVSAIRMENQQRWIQMTAAISPGSSGSPVLNEAGEVIGVATATMVHGQALNMAVPVEAVKKLMQAPEAAAVAAAAAIAPVEGVAAVAAGGAEPCKVCGTSRGKVQGGDAKNVQAEYRRKWHFLCRYCANGRTLVLECYHLLHRVMENNKKLVSESNTVLSAMESRQRDFEVKRKSLRKDVQTYEASKVDVRDEHQKAEARLRELDKSYEKLMKELEDTRRHRDHCERDAVRYFEHWVEYLKREMVTMEVPIPETIEAGALPPFNLGTSMGRYYCYYGFTLEDLIVSARFNLDNKGKPSAAALAQKKDPRPKKQVTLKNGKEIISKMIVEDGENYIIKGEDGKMQTVPKKDVDSIFDQ